MLLLAAAAAWGRLGGERFQIWSGRSREFGKNAALTACYNAISRVHYAPERCRAGDFARPCFAFFGQKPGNEASTNGFRGVLHEAEGPLKTSFLLG